MFLLRDNLLKLAADRADVKARKSLDADPFEKAVKVGVVGCIEDPEVLEPSGNAPDRLAAVKLGVGAVAPAEEPVL